ncbi:hypothetical protein V493_00345, partial [Pseudogymnoascus sp. VKM F-4281 (FW-2241)]
FLPPKIMQADNGKEFKGALLLLLQKYGIQVVNGAPRSPQTQGLVEQANGVVENKLRAWKMDHGSTEWKDGLLEPELESELEALINPRLRQREPELNSELNSELSSGSEREPERELNSKLSLRTRAQARTRARAGVRAQLWQAQELRIELSGSELNSELSSGSEREPEREPERELNSKLSLRTRAQARTRARTRARAGARTQLRQAPELGIEFLGSEFNSEPSSGSEREPALNSELCRLAPTRAQARVLAQLQAEPEFCSELSSSRLQARAPEPRIEFNSSELNSEPSSSSGSSLGLELRRGTQARVPAQPRTELWAAPDPVIERAIAATQRARISMVRKYTKKHDIQHFDIGAIVSIKVPREDRTSTDNKRLFARILEEPYPHRYRILTASGIIQRLIPTKSLGVVEQAL